MTREDEVSFRARLFGEGDNDLATIARALVELAVQAKRYNDYEEA